ncbi:ATP-binding cassette domain-containing protein [Facklamia languida]
MYDSIKIKTLGFSFKKSKPLFHRLKYSFEKNKKYVIIGSSGSGKSTLLNIIAGKISDYSGKIEWDNVNYHKIMKRALQDQIIFIDQAPYIFNASIRENITLLDSYSERDIQEVISTVGLDSWVSNLKDGLETVINFNAKNISGGEKQRIALARGLLKNKSILLLDEPTSSLDDKSASDIEELIFKNSSLTVIMVTHQLRESISQLADEIIELE